MFPPFFTCNISFISAHKEPYKTYNPNIPLFMQVHKRFVAEKKQKFKIKEL
jgi:hypothetical protein